MSSTSTVIKDTFKKFRDTNEPVKQAIILQVMLEEDNSVILTDGRNTVHYGYQREDAVKSLLQESLEEGGFEEDHLDGSYFSFAEVSFDYFWDLAKKQLVVCLLSSHARLIDSGIGQKKPWKTFYITMELSTRRQEMLKRQAMAKSIKTEEEGLPLDDIFGLATTGGINTSLQKEESLEEGEEEEDAESNQENSAKCNTTTQGDRTDISQGITPNKVEITQLGQGQKAADQDKENINIGKIETEKIQKDSEPDTDALADQSNKPEKKRKPRAKKPKPEFAKKEKATEEELALLEDELEDLDLDEEVQKQMTKVKTNFDPIRRGGKTTATEDEIRAPQTLGLSTFSLISGSGFF